MNNSNNIMQLQQKMYDHLLKQLADKNGTFTSNQVEIINKNLEWLEENVHIKVYFSINVQNNQTKIVLENISNNKKQKINVFNYRYASNKEKLIQSHLETLLNQIGLVLERVKVQDALDNSLLFDVSTTTYYDDYETYTMDSEAATVSMLVSLINLMLLYQAKYCTYEYETTGFFNDKFQYDKLYEFIDGEYKASEYSDSFMPEKLKFKATSKKEFKLMHEVREKNTYNNIVYAAALSGVIRSFKEKYSQEDSIFININGAPGSGKTTLEKIVLGMFGNSNSLIKYFNDTDAAIEKERVRYGIVPIIMDEQMLKFNKTSKKNRETAIINQIFINYSGRAKQNNYNVEEEHTNIINAFIGSSVESLLSYTTTDVGQLRRVLELDYNKKNNVIIDLSKVDEYMSTLTEEGYYLKDYIEVIKNSEKTIESLDSDYKKHCTDPRIRLLAIAYYFMLETDNKLSSKYELQLTEVNPEEKVINFINECKEIQEYNRALLKDYKLNEEQTNGIYVYSDSSIYKESEAKKKLREHIEDYVQAIQNITEITDLVIEHKEENKYKLRFSSMERMDCITKVFILGILRENSKDEVAMEVQDLLSDPSYYNETKKKFDSNKRDLPDILKITYDKRRLLSRANKVVTINLE